MRHLALQVFAGAFVLTWLGFVFFWIGYLVTAWGF